MVQSMLCRLVETACLGPIIQQSITLQDLHTLELVVLWAKIELDKWMSQYLLLSSRLSCQFYFRLFSEVVTWRFIDKNWRDRGQPR